MRPILLFAAVTLMIAGLVPRLIAIAPQPANVTALVSAAPATPHSVTLRSTPSGHYETEAEVDGRRLQFLVDTGASAVTLRESDADRLGLHPNASDYKVAVTTANGTARAAHYRVNRIDVGDIVVHDVEVIVMPDSALSVNLLGMTFLGRISLQQQYGKLILEQ